MPLGDHRRVKNAREKIHETLYIHVPSMDVKPLKKLKGHPITPVAWNRSAGREDPSSRVSGSCGPPDVLGLSPHGDACALSLWLLLVIYTR